jgi:hypothetical protein
VGAAVEDPETSELLNAYQAMSGRLNITLRNQSQFGQTIAATSVDIGSIPLTAPIITLDAGHPIPPRTNPGVPGPTGTLAGTVTCNQSTPASL